MEINTQNPIKQKENFYEWTHIESISNKALYEKFLNWVSGEFDIFLQDHLNGLQIFFPGGYFNITETKANNKINGFKIMVKSKYKQKGIQINNQVYTILNHALNLKKPSMS